MSTLQCAARIVGDDDDERHLPLIDPLGRFAALASTVGSVPATRGLLQIHREQFEARLAALADAFADASDGPNATNEFGGPTAQLEDVVRALHRDVIEGERTSPMVGFDLAGVVVVAAGVMAFSVGSISVARVRERQTDWVLTGDRARAHVGAVTPIGRMELQVLGDAAPTNSPRPTTTAYLLQSPGMRRASEDVVTELVGGLPSAVAAEELLARDAMREAATKDRALVIAHVV